MAVTLRLGLALAFVAGGSLAAGTTVSRDGDLSWSPDGRAIALAYGGWSVNWSRIEVVDVRTGRLRRLTSTGPNIDFAPSWSPDGRRLAFARWQRNRTRKNPSIAIVSRRGGAVRVLPDAEVEFDSARVAWRPRAAARDA